MYLMVFKSLCICVFTFLEAKFLRFLMNSGPLYVSLGDLMKRVALHSLSVSV